MKHKSRILWLLVVCWPGVTLLLQRAFDVDPWKLMSFGMYATPPRRPEDLGLTLQVRAGDGWREVLEDEVAEEARAFRANKQVLGELASAEPLLRRLLERTGASEAKVTWRAPRLDARSNRIVFVGGEARASSVAEAKNNP